MYLPIGFRAGDVYVARASNIKAQFKLPQKESIMRLENDFFLKK